MLHFIRYFPYVYIKYLKKGPQLSTIIIDQYHRNG